MRKPLLSLVFLALVFLTQAGFSRGGFVSERSPTAAPLLGDLFNVYEFPFVQSEEQEIFSLGNLFRQKLARIISEPEGGRIHNLVLELDENHKIVTFNRETEGTNDRQVVKIQDLMKRPVVLARTSDRDILVLMCKGCNAERGGAFQLNFLYNGITMKYKSLKLEFKYSQQQSLWQLYAEKNKKMVLVDYLRLIPRHIFGQLVGIKKIQVNE